MTLFEAEQRAKAERAANYARALWGVLWEEMVGRPGDWSINAEGVGALMLRVHHNGHLVATSQGDDYVKVFTDVLHQLGVTL